MPTVFDQATGQAVPDLPPDQAAAGLASGKLGLDSKAGPVSLVGKSGKAYQFAPDQVAGVLAQHPNAYRLQTHEEEVASTVAKQEAAKGLMGSVGEAGSSALNQLLMGAPEAYVEGTETPDEKLAREARQKYHSTARILGGVAGFGGSLLAGGELFKGAELAGQAVEHGILPAADLAEAGLAHKLAATAANYATQGALLSSPEALAQAAAGDPKKAAETMLWGLGGGMVLGSGVEALHSAGSAIADKALGMLGDEGISGAIDKFANDTGVKVLGGQRAQINKLKPGRAGELVDFAHEEGLIQPGMSRQEVGEAVHEAHEKYGSDIGGAIENLDSALGVDKAAEASAPSEVTKVKRTGAEIGDFLKENPERAADFYNNPNAHPDILFKTEGAPPTRPSAVSSVKPEVLDAAIKPGDISDHIREALDSPELNMPMNRDQKAALDDVVKSASMLPTTNINGTSVVSFEDAQKFVSDLRKKWVGAVSKAQNEGGVRGLETVTALDQMKSSAYQVAKDFLHQAADNVAVASENPELVGALAKAKQKYAKLSELEKWVANREAQQAGNRTMGLTDFLHMGAMGTTGAGIGGAIGSLAGPMGTAAGAAVGHASGAVLGLLAKRWMEDRGLVHISSIAKRAAKDGAGVFTSVLGIDGQRRLEASVDTIGEALHRMAQRGLGETSAAGSSDHMNHLLGGTQGLSKDDQYEKLTNRIATLSGNPQALASATAAASAPIAAASPKLAAVYQQKLVDAVNYLAQSMPKQPAPMPFSPTHAEPSEKEKLAFHDKLEILHNPMRAITHIERGTLSADHLDSLQANYPTIQTMMRQKILEFAADHPKLKLPRAERASVAMFLGQPTDETSRPENMTLLQSMYAQHPSQPNAAPGKQRMPKGKIKNFPSASSSFSGTMGPSSTGA